MPQLEVRVYGGGAAGCRLYEDDGATLQYRKGEYNRLQLTWNAGTKQGSAAREGRAVVPAYAAKQWIEI